MAAKKSYKISDLFVTRWSDEEGRPTLTTAQMAELLTYRYQLDDARIRKDAKAEGHYAIMILKLLRIHKSAVSRISVEQVVDCINDITFFRSPWYFFPPCYKTLFHHPDERMHDRTIEQLTYADSAYTKYLVLQYQSRKGALIPEKEFQQTLDELIAVLYTPEDLFDPAQISDRVEHVDHLKEFEKLIIFHTYANIREYIVERYPNLFPKSSNDGEGSGDKPPVHTGPMWRNLLFDFSETEAFKGFDRAKNTRIYTALDYLEKKTKDAKEVKPISRRK